MNNVDTILNSIRLNVIEDLLCKDPNFRMGYLDALNILSNVIKENEETSSKELTSGLDNVICRINKTPSKL